MPSTPFYPSLVDLLPIDKIPAQLGVFQDLLENIFDDLYYKDLQSSSSHRGDAAFYKLKIVSYNRIGVELPGTGFALVLNPSLGPGSTNSTEFDVSLNYELEILKHVPDFNLVDFASSPKAFYDLLLEIANVDEVEFLNEVIHIFYEGIQPFQDFADHINTIYSATLNILSDPNPKVVIQNLIDQMSDPTGLNLEVFEALYNDIINIGKLDEVFRNLKSVFRRWLGEFDFDDIKQLFIPKVNAAINGLVVGVEFPASFLRKVDPSSFEPLSHPVTGNDIPSILAFDFGTISYGSTSGLKFENQLSASLPPSELLKSGFILDITSAKLDLSRTTNIPEATAAGRNNDFVGIYAQEATLAIPSFWNQQSSSTGIIKGTDLLIGTGGLTGTFELEATSSGNPTPVIDAKFGGFEVTLDQFRMSFDRNAVTESQIAGTLTIPKWEMENPGGSGLPDVPAQFDIDIFIGSDGDFSVTADPAGTLPLLKLKDILAIKIDELSVGREDNRFYITLSGAIELEDFGGSIGKFLPEAIKVQKLTIWDDGEFEIEGGHIVLNEPIPLEVPPVKISITGIHIGSYEGMHNNQLRKYKYFGFDGGLSLDPGGVDARGKGIKFYFTSDNDPSAGKNLHFFMRIQSISIDMIIPGDASAETAAAIISGYLSMKDSASGGGGTEYVGGIDFSLPKLKIAGGAAMRYNPDVPSFLVDANLQIPVPILLGTSGLGIYGFQGLFGERYVTRKSAAGLSEDARWWEYYKAKIDPDYREGITVPKFAQEPGFSIGAGTSIATAADSGYTFSSKLAFILSLREGFLLIGQANILAPRVGLDSNDPPYFFLLQISDDSIEAAFGANFLNEPGTGFISNVNGILEMGYFFQDASAWYINVGRELPESQRVTAKLFTLFDAYFYMMISGQGIRAGAGVSYDLEKRFGPLKAKIGAYIDVEGRLSFSPTQIGGMLALGGYLDLKAFGVGLSLSADAIITAEAPKPFMLSGKVEGCIEVIFKKACAKFSFTWTFDKDQPKDPLPIMKEDELNQVGKAVHMVTQETFPLYTLKVGGTIPKPSALGNLDDFIIPVDSFIDLELDKGIHPFAPDLDVTTGLHHPSLSRIGGILYPPEFWELVSPRKVKSDRILHLYLAQQINIYCWNPATTKWEDYNPYDAIDVNGLVFNNTNPVNTSRLQLGNWQLTSPGKYNKLRVLAQTPFSYTKGNGDNSGLTIEHLDIDTEEIYCEESEIEKTCTYFENVVPEKINVSAGEFEAYGSGHVLIRPLHSDGTVKSIGAGIGNGFTVESRNHSNGSSQQGQIEVTFNEPQPHVALKIATTCENVRIYYYQRGQKFLAGAPVVSEEDDQPVFEYRLASNLPSGMPNPRQMNAAVLAQQPTVIYQESENIADIKHAIDRVVIESGSIGINTPWTCGENSALMNDLQTLLNGAWQQNLLLGSNLERVYPGTPSLLTSLFLGTELYPNDPQNQGVNDIEFELSGGGTGGYTGSITILENGVETCRIELQGPILGSQIFALGNIRPNTSTGDAHDFLIDAFDDSFEPLGTLQGSISCKEVSNCWQACSTSLLEVCTLDIESYLYNSNIVSQDALNEELVSVDEAMKHTIQPIWRPNTMFAIELRVSDLVHQETKFHQRSQDNYVFAFKTAGPLGHFHKYPTINSNTVNIHPSYQAKIAANATDEYKLDKLLHYLDLKKSFPNADGNIIAAKPLFYAFPKLQLFYKYNHVHGLFIGWQQYKGNEALDAALRVVIKDPVEPVDLPTSSQTSSSSSWVEETDPVLTQDDQIMQQLIANGGGCISIPSFEKKSLASEFALPTLKPLKAYTAIFQTEYARSVTDSSSGPKMEEIHRYIFQTSRYPDFATQINSWKLLVDASGNVEKEAVFQVEQPFTAATITQAKSIVNDTMTAADPLRVDFGNAFDRLMDGVLKVNGLNPPQTTEFNVIKNLDSNKIIGVLIRNPEPFNDPKLPTSEMAQTLQVLVNGAVNSSTRVLFAKDNASAFVTNTAFDLATTAYTFRFNYRLFDGSSYQNVAGPIDVPISL